MFTNDLWDKCITPNKVSVRKKLESFWKVLVEITETRNDMSKKNDTFPINSQTYVEIFTLQEEIDS